MYFLLTRPEEDNNKLARNLETLGHQVWCDPLLVIEIFRVGNIAPDRFQAIIFTSANGVRAFVHNSQDRDIPCYAVGQATAGTARDAGFRSVQAAGGDVEKLAGFICHNLSPEQGPLLHISGRDVAGDLSKLLEKAGFHVACEKLYRATRVTNLSAITQGMIKAGQISHIPFFSPRTAKTFITLIKKAGLENYLTEITALCLSSAVSDVIKSLCWHEILTAKQPDQVSLFDLIDVKLEENRQ